VFSFAVLFAQNLCNYLLLFGLEYRTVSGVAGPLVILDKVKVHNHLSLLVKEKT
jgi:hypothetical protein